MSSNLTTKSITSGSALSESARIDSGFLLGIAVPSDWTTADVSFQGSFDNNTWYSIYREGTEYKFTPVAGEMHILDPLITAIFKYVRVRSGTKASPVNQTGGNKTVIFSIQETL